MVDPLEPDFEVVIIGAGVGGICQIQRLVERGVNAVVLEGADDLGGTWYRNRYPGARFDSESYTYGYSFSKELLEEWHWTERFSSQPETLRYLNYVAEKFDLRPHIRFNRTVEAMRYNESEGVWRLRVREDGSEVTARFVITAIGILSVPTLPRIAGIDLFEGQSFHTHFWPHEPVELAGKRVAVIGTGATGIQVIAEIADKVGHLTVLQRRPNWAAPLGNSRITEEEMAEIRSSYDEIFATCARTPSGFVHEFDKRGFYDLTHEERVEFWDSLYGTPGFAIWLRNFKEILTDEVANAEFSEYIANRIRERVRDPAVAEKLIPKDHGFGVQRIPMETNYFEAYNRSNVELVDISETPIGTITTTGLRTSEREFEFDIIVYATGFDAITGAFDRIDIVGREGQRLRDKWKDGPSTGYGLLVHGFPNMFMLAGPQSGSSSTNFPRSIETGVGWITGLLDFIWSNEYRYVDVSAETEAAWTEHVEKMYAVVLMRNAKGWFTGYNSNLDGHEHGKTRYLVYNGGATRYVSTINEVATNNYEGFDFA